MYSLLYRLGEILKRESGEIECVYPMNMKKEGWERR